MASDWAKWSNYVHSCILDTQGVNATPFCGKYTGSGSQEPRVDSALVFSDYQRRMRG